MEGRASEVLTLQKGEAETVLDLLKGGRGNTARFWIVLIWELEVMAILTRGVQKNCHALKGGCEKISSVLIGGGGRKRFWIAIFPFCNPHPLPPN